MSNGTIDSDSVVGVLLTVSITIYSYIIRNSGTKVLFLRTREPSTWPKVGQNVPLLQIVLHNFCEDLLLLTAVMKTKLPYSAEVGQFVPPFLYYSSVGCCKSTNNTQPRIIDVQTLFLNKTSVIRLCDSGSRSTSVATPARTTMATARATIFPSRTMATSCVVVPRMRKEPRQHQ